jgi:uncharacterized membrane protein YgcG
MGIWNWLFGKKSNAATRPALFDDLGTSRRPPRIADAPPSIVRKGAKLRKARGHVLPRPLPVKDVPPARKKQVEDSPPPRRKRDDDDFGSAVAGAVVGGLIGGALGGSSNGDSPGFGGGGLGGGFDGGFSGGGGDFGGGGGGSDF